MSEATTLYWMVSVVIAGLVVWVAYVLATVKTPWARGPIDPLPAAAGGLVPSPALASAMTTGAHLPLAEIDPSVGADDTARATPVALSEGRARAVDVMMGGVVTSTMTAPDGTTLEMQEILVGWLGAEDSVPQFVRRTKEEARVLAEQVVAKAKAGEDFSALQTEYNDPRHVDPTESRLAHTKKAFEVARELAIGATSEAVETPAGFSVVKRLAVGGRATA